MLTPSFIALTALVALLALAVRCDLRSRRIPNPVNAAALAAGLLSAWLAPLPGVSVTIGGALLGCALTLLLLLPLYALRALGAGDVKLLVAVAAWLGVGDVGWLLLLTLLAGGIVGLVVGLQSGTLRRAVHHVVFSASATVVELQAGGLPKARASSTLRLPYALPIAVGALLTLGRHHVGG